MQRFGFLLIPGFSMLSLAAAVEPLRMANAQAEEELYQWDFLSWDNTSVNASNNMVTAPTIDVDQVKMLDVLLVVAGINVATYGDDVFFAWLRQASRQVDLLGSTSTGALLLAKAKLLRHKTCTIHWEYVDSFREQFPDVWMSGELYEFDGSLFTCSGGSAGLDMMLQIIADQHGIGTNCLLFDSTLKFKLYFGPNSFYLFQQAFKEHVFTFESPSITSLQQDLDSDDDYFKLIKYVEV